MMKSMQDYIQKLEEKELEVIKLKQEVRHMEKEQAAVLESWEADRASLNQLQETMEKAARGKDSETNRSEQSQLQEALLEKAKQDMQRLEKEYGAKLETRRLQEVLQMTEEKAKEALLEKEVSGQQARETFDAKAASLQEELETSRREGDLNAKRLEQQCEQVQQECDRLLAEVKEKDMELSRRSADFQQEKANTESRCSELLTECSRLSSVVASLSQQSEANADELSRKVSELETEKEQRQKAHEEKTDLEQRHVTALQAHDSLKEEREQLITHLEDLKAVTTTLDQKLQEGENRQLQLVSELQKIQTESDDRLAECKAVELERDEVQEQLEQVQVELKEVLQAKCSIEAEFSSVLAAKQGMAEKVAEHVQKLDRLSGLQKQIEAMQQEKEKERQEAEKLHNSLVEQVAASEKMLQGLKQDKADSEERLALLQTQMDNLQEEKKKEREELETQQRDAEGSLNSQINDLNAEKQKSSEEVLSLKREKDELLQQIQEDQELQQRYRYDLDQEKATRAEIEQRLEEEQMRMTSQLTHLREDSERQRAESEAKGAQEVAKLNEEMAEKSAQWEKEKQQLLTQLSDKEVAYEQKLLTQEEQSNWAISELRAEYKQDHASMEALVEAAERRLEEAQEQHKQRLSEKEQEVASLQEQHLSTQSETERRFDEDIKKREEETRQKAGEQQRQMQQLQQDLEAAQEFCQRLSTEKINLLSETAQAQSSADQILGDTKASYETRLNEKSQALAAMEEAYRQVEALHKSSLSELQAAEERLTDQERDLADKTARIKCLHADIAEQEGKISNLQQEVEQFRNSNVELDRAIVEVRSANERRLSQLQAEKERAAHTIQQLSTDLEQLERDKEKLLLEKEQMCQRLAHEQQEMSKKTELLSKEYEKKIEENDTKVSKTMEEFRSERDRLSAEKAEMNRRMEAYREECERKMQQDEKEMISRMESFRAECDQRMKQEKENMAKMTQELHDKAHEQVAREQQAAERRMAEIRAHTEEQLRREREVSDSVRHVLRELPPLQAAMELGDLASLEMELDKWRGQVISDRFGDCKGVVEAVVNMAKERLMTWRAVDHTWKEVIREVERIPSTLASLTNQCQRLFRALKEAQLTKMDLRRSDPGSVDKALEVLLAWKEKAMVCNNSVQTLIVQKVMSCQQLGPFDFADLDICLRLVDRSEGGPNQVFLSRATVLVQDEKVAPKDLKGLLAHIETMLFFLKYAKSEDLSLTHKEFKKQSNTLHPSVVGYLDWAQRQYGPGKELVDLSRSHSLMDSTDVSSVLSAMRPASGTHSGLDIFREIFYQWALCMRKQFNLLVLPHHTQVVCLLAFQRFLEAPDPTAQIRALIAQVGTGEGKSMIVAALAIYVVVALKKKVHVVVDDETLLDRDFAAFRRLFEAFSVEENGKRRPLTAMLCVSEERLNASKGAQGLAARVDGSADICYCEAKHVQSFYASIARSEQDARDFDSYSGRVLILDEVDALVIDEEPNEPFVYPNQQLSQLATSVAKALHEGATPGSDVLHRLRTSGHPAAARVVHEMCKEWERGQKMLSGEDFVYNKESARYCALQSGRANPKAWSLALECRNFRDGLSKEIFYQERLFVMSRPRVFRRYHRILGLSGSIGSNPERRFLQETYRAAFFEVPPFLKTCRGSPFHEPLPAKLGSSQAAIYVEETVEAQTSRIAEVAFEARERVPVLIIARDRVHADQLVESLQLSARSRGLGGTCEDAVRSLSRTLYEAEPEQWKENLNRATMPLGQAEGRNKSWRITVTDRRGGRGTDYRVDDSDVDGGGGLLLIPAVVPTSQREWTQFLGRTARQDRRGQFCAVLCAKDYATLSSKYKEPMPQGGCGLEPVQMVLHWGDLETAERIKGSAALYNCGVRVNELCEEVFGKRQELLRDPAARERLVDVCQRLRWMSVQEVDEAFARLPGFNPKQVLTEAKDLGRPEVPPVSTPSTMPSSGAAQVLSGGAKVVIFCLDWSASMKSNDTRTSLNRFQTCVQCILRILQDQVRDNDVVGVVCFGPNVQTIVTPTPKGAGGQMLQTRVASLTPSNAGGTCFYDAVLECLRMLSKPSLVPNEAARWLVCLTDGDDLGSSRPNARGQLVSQMLASGSVLAALNMVMITVGTLKAENVQVIQSWVKQVSSQGGKGLHLGDKDATGIAKAFDVVAEFLAAEVGGATEC